MARVYTVPSFNIGVDFWTLGHNPLTTPADAADVPGQIYINSRAPMQQLSDNDPSWLFLIILRIPLGVYAPIQNDIWRESPAIGNYHKVIWVQSIHRGFPNEYLAVYSARSLPSGQTLDPIGGP